MAVGPVPVVAVVVAVPADVDALLCGGTVRGAEGPVLGPAFVTPCMFSMAR